MNWTLAVLQAVIIAGLSAIISYVISTRQKRLEFNFNYRKYILDKRIASYEKIETLISRLRRYHRIATNVSVAAVIWESHDTQILTIFKTEVAEIIIDGFWLSNDMRTLLIKLQAFINKIRTEHPNQNIATEEIIEISKKYGAELNQYNKTLTAQFFKDLETLDNIKSFKYVAVKHID